MTEVGLIRPATDTREARNRARFAHERPRSRHNRGGAAKPRNGPRVAVLGHIMILGLHTPTPLVIELVGDHDESSLADFLEDVALELRFAGDPQRVVVDLRLAGRLPPGADLALLAFLVEHTYRLERLAVVTHDEGASHRAASLALQSRREIRIFEQMDDALRWAMNP